MRNFFQDAHHSSRCSSASPVSNTGMILKVVISLLLYCWITFQLLLALLMLLLQSNESWCVAKAGAGSHDDDDANQQHLEKSVSESPLMYFLRDHLWLYRDCLTMCECYFALQRKVQYISVKESPQITVDRRNNRFFCGTKYITVPFQLSDAEGQ